MNIQGVHADIKESDDLNEGDLKAQAGQDKPVVLAQFFLDSSLVMSQGVDRAVNRSHFVLL